MKNKQLQLPNTDAEEAKLEPAEGLPERHEYYLDHISGQDSQHEDEPARGRDIDDDDEILGDEEDEDEGERR